MKQSRALVRITRRLSVLCLLAAAAVHHAGTPAAAAQVTAPTTADTTVVATTAGATTAAAQEGGDGNRYGLFNLLDHRSRYGHYWFPEPFRLDETDLDNELRADWVHQEGKGHVNDTISVEIEKSFGLTTLELEIPYEKDSVRTDTGHDRARGVGNIELSLRRPFYQAVSNNGVVDNTVGLGVELGIPTNSPVSQDTELVGKVFDALRLGEHFSLQSIFGYSVLIGPEDGGARTFEYGLVAGYSIGYKELNIPTVTEIVPIFELKGEKRINGEHENDLSGTAGVRVNFEGVGPFQPKLGIGYVFPISSVAREDAKWGIVTSLVFEY